MVDYGLQLRKPTSDLSKIGEIPIYRLEAVDRGNTQI
jgi:hypothetical protein